MPLRLGLRGKLLIPLLVISLLSLIWGWFDTVSRVEKILLAEVERDLRQQASSLQFVAESTSNVDTLHRYVTAIAAQPHVESVFVLAHRKGAVVAASRAEWLHLHVQSNGPWQTLDLSRVFLQRHTVFQRLDHSSALVAAPVIWSQKMGDERFGALVIHVNISEQLERSRSESAAVALRNSLQLLVVVAVVLFLVWRWVLQPAARFRDALARASRGERARLAWGSGDEMGELAQQFNQTLHVRRRAERQARLAQRAAERLAAARAQFMARVSHELRTPLTVIRGFAEQMLEPSLAPDTRRSLNQKLLQNTRYLLTLINDLLDASRLEQGRVSLEHISFRPADLAAQLDSMFTELAGARGLRLRVHVESGTAELLSGDPVRLLQVLVNLTGNALKFTSQGGVNVEFSSPHSGGLCITVTDTGLGISVEQLRKLFAPFVQADGSITRRFGGTGLGLYIARQLVTLMGGQLDVTSTPGAGSVFTVFVPLPRATGEPAWRPVTDADVHGPVVSLEGRVLIADDMADIRELYALILAPSGVELSFAGDGEEAVWLARNQRFDLLILDMHMPGRTGMDVLQALRSLGIQTPAAIATASLMPDEITAYREAGFAACIGKPLDRQQLMAVLQTHLPPPKSTVAALQTAKPAGGQAQASVMDALPEFVALKKRFLANALLQVEALRKAAREGDVAGVAAVAHKLKGGGGSFGYPAITAAAKALETAARQEPPAELALLIDDLDIVLASLSA